MSDQPRRRGRPPAYDRPVALRAITTAFWDRGFAATSLDDLAATTAMNRPSLYAAFGDKQAMYLAALEHYRRDAEIQLRALMDSEPRVAAAIHALLRAGVDFYLAGTHGPRGCLAVCTATAEAATVPETRAALAAMLATLDGLVADRLARGVRDGELPADFDCPGHAMLVAAMLHSIAARARSGAPRAALLAMADRAAAALMPRPCR